MPWKAIGLLPHRQIGLLWDCSLYWEWDWFPSWLFSEEGKPQFNSCFSPREWKKKGARVNNSFNQPHTHETKGIFFAAQPEEEGSDWHSDFAASHCGREVFCSHYSPMVLVIDGAFSWLWQRIKVSLSIISFTFPACFPPLCASSRAHVQLTLSEHGDLLWICINAKDCLIFFSAAMAGWSNSLASILLMKECTSLQQLAHRWPTPKSGIQARIYSHKQFRKHIVKTDETLIVKWCASTFIFLKQVRHTSMGWAWTR